MSNPTNYPHIEKRADGKLWLIATQTKVLEVALDRLAHHWDADEIHGITGSEFAWAKPFAIWS